jgi:hypothetical protein
MALGCGGGAGRGKPRPLSGYTRLSPPPVGAWIDCHAHLQPLYRTPGGGLSFDWSGAEREALAKMDSAGISRTVIMPPPVVPGQEGIYDAPELSKICSNSADRFTFMAGGGSLNPMIHKAWLQGTYGPRMEREFRNTAEGILALGAVGFGEMAAEHFSFTDNHPYESAPPDSRLFLLLADIAADRHVPIDLHMEAVPTAMDLPAHLASPPNPKRLRPNIAGLEKLLKHNRKARIFWSHVGWGHTSMRSPSLCRRLLERHPNLFMSFKVHRHSSPETRALARGRIKPEWLSLVQQFPERFVMGSDQFYVTPWSDRQFPNSLVGALAVLASLPMDLAQQVGQKNPGILFKL